MYVYAARCMDLSWSPRLVPDQPDQAKLSLSVQSHHHMQSVLATVTSLLPYLPTPRHPYPPTCLPPYPPTYAGCTARNTDAPPHRQPTGTSRQHLS